MKAPGSSRKLGRVGRAVGASQEVVKVHERLNETAQVCAQSALARCADASWSNRNHMRRHLARIRLTLPRRLITGERSGLTYAPRRFPWADLLPG